MAGLIDHIFDNIDIAHLSRSQVHAYTAYLTEIFEQNLTVDQIARYQRIKVRLEQRLMELNHEGFRGGLTTTEKNSSFLLLFVIVSWLAVQVVKGPV